MPRHPGIPAAPPGSAGITIATLYRRYPPGELPLDNMASVMWLRLSQQFARLGFRVDVIATPPERLARAAEGVQFVPFSDFRPDAYEVVAPLFHRGYLSLAAAGGERHPLIISAFGSVVGHRDGIPGVHFLGEERKAWYDVQRRAHERARCVAVMTEESRELWKQDLGPRDNLLLIPNGTDSSIPPPNQNPYRAFDERIAVYIGSLYTGWQKEVNLLWQRRLNRVGRLLKRKEIRLCLVGPGEVEELDPGAVTYLGAVDNERVWDYHHFADVGVVLAQGPVQHNESSKLYYYLRAGLPVVSEAPVPNNGVLRAAGLGLVADYDDDRMMADMIEEAASRRWPREAAVAYILAHHTWERRARAYAEAIHRALGR